MQKQNGVLFRLDPTDYIAGVNSPIVLTERTSEWEEYMPTPELQYVPFKFDSNACTVHGGLHSIDAQVNFLIKQKAFTTLQMSVISKYLDANGKFDSSVRFTSIMSGTMRNGNYPQNPLHSARNDGLIPDTMLPMGGNSWDEYHDKALITEEMKSVAKTLTKILDIQYELVFFDEDPAISRTQADAIVEQLKYAPLAVATPIPGTHMFTLYKVKKESKLYIMDQYEPFFKTEKWKFPLHYGYRPYVTVKDESEMFNILKKGSKGIEVKKLQTALNELGYSVGVADGDFGNKTELAVKAFQKASQLVVDGIAGVEFWKALDEKQKAGGLKPLVYRKAQELIKKAKEAGENIRITETNRTNERQTELWNQGRTTAGPIVTNAKAGESLHNYGVAFDICFEGSVPYPTDDKRWKKIADIGVSIGLTAGYYFKSFQDKPHFQLDTIKYIVDDYKNNKVDYTKYN